jgi:uncharacterized protein (DUF4213/DUF364 family)
MGQFTFFIVEEVRESGVVFKRKVAKIAITGNIETVREIVEHLKSKYTIVEQEEPELAT